jgi:hypothetical protein
VPILIGPSIARWGRSVESQLKDTRQSDAAAARQSRGLFALIPIERTTHGGQVKRLRRRTTSSATPRAIGRRPPKRARGRRWSTVPPHVRMTRPRLSEFETAPMSLLCADSDTGPARSEQRESRNGRDSGPDTGTVPSGLSLEAYEKVSSVVTLVKNHVVGLWAPGRVRVPKRGSFAHSFHQ